jgi:hypothetical protein
MQEAAMEAGAGGMCSLAQPSCAVLHTRFMVACMDMLWFQPQLMEAKDL